jgi:hypothetical protein
MGLSCNVSELIDSGTGVRRVQYWDIFLTILLWFLLVSGLFAIATKCVMKVGIKTLYVRKKIHYIMLCF